MPTKVRFVEDYKAENPNSGVSLQADDEVQAMRLRIKAAGVKALDKLLKVLVAEG